MYIPESDDTTETTDLFRLTGAFRKGVSDVTIRKSEYTLATAKNS